MADIDAGKESVVDVDTGKESVADVDAGQESVAAQAQERSLWQTSTQERSLWQTSTQDRSLWLTPTQDRSQTPFLRLGWKFTLEIRLEVHYRCLKSGWKFTTGVSEIRAASRAADAACSAELCPGLAHVCAAGHHLAYAGQQAQERSLWRTSTQDRSLWLPPTQERSDIYY